MFRSVSFQCSEVFLLNVKSQEEETLTSESSDYPLERKLGSATFKGNLKKVKIECNLLQNGMKCRSL